MNCVSDARCCNRIISKENGHIFRRYVAFGYFREGISENLLKTTGFVHPSVDVRNVMVKFYAEFCETLCCFWLHWQILIKQKVFLKRKIIPRHDSVDIFEILSILRDFWVISNFLILQLLIVKINWHCVDQLSAFLTFEPLICSVVIYFTFKM